MKSLRFFYAAHPSPDAIAFPHSQLWHHNLYAPLVDLGHDVVRFDYDLTPHMQRLDPGAPGAAEFIEQHRPRLEVELLRQIEAAHRERPIDVFFSYFYSACARPETIRAIGGMGITTMNWYCNGSYQFHLVSEIAPAYDFCLVPEAFRMDDYRRIGARPIYCQEAANPNVYRPFPGTREFDVVFVGQRYGDRPSYVRRLYDAGIPIRVWGANWLPQRRAVPLLHRLHRALSGGRDDPDIPAHICGPPLGDDDLIRMYSRTKISLGFSTCGDTHLSGTRIVQVRLRDFEAPMSGAFYMVEFMPELADFYEIGREIVCYVDPDDLVEKVRYFLSHDDEREAIREAGHARARRDHTWHKRFEQVFRQTGLI